MVTLQSEKGGLNKFKEFAINNLQAIVGGDGVGDDPVIDKNKVKPPGKKKKI